MQGMENDPESAECHGLDRLDKDSKASHVKDAPREEDDFASMLGDATATLKLLEPAVEAVEETKYG